MEKYMEMALKEAKKASKKGEVPVGCVIVYKNKIIAKSHNTKEQKKCALNHAEILAIKKASKKLNNWRLLGCEIYVTKQPCPMCMSAIEQARCEKLIYGVSSNNIETSKLIVVSGVLEKETKDLLKSFFKKRRNSK